MALSTSGIRVDGLFSNIDYSGIISKLMAVEQQPISLLQGKVKKATQQKTAFLSTSARLSVIQGTAANIAGLSLWKSTSVASSNENVLFASGSTVASTGAYNFSVKRLAQSHHMLSSGYADYNSTKPAPSGGTMTIETGAGYLDRETSLSFLNGMQGVDRGSVKITDKEGNISTIDLTGASTVQDVLDLINSDTNLNISAYVRGDRIMLEDTNSGVGTMLVENVGTDTTATDLGLTASTAAGATRVLSGGNINYVSSSTAMSLLNDGNGVRHNSDALDDFRITTKNGSNFDINVKDAHVTLSDLKSAIEAITGANVTVSIENHGLKLKDNTAGVGTFQVTALNNSNAALDLGLVRLDATGNIAQIAKEDSATGTEGGTASILSGDRVWSDLNSLLRRSLRGGEARYWTDGTDALKRSIDDGSMTLTDRSSASTTVDLSRRIAKNTTALASAGDTTITLNSVTGLAVGNMIRITDGTNSEYKTITGIAGNNVTFTGQALANGYANGSGVYAYHQSVSDMVNTINYQAQTAGVDISVKFNDENNGIYAAESSGASAVNFQVSDAGSVVEQLFGAEINTANTSYNGYDLDPQYMSEETKLSSLNYGNGVYAGKFIIYDKDGKSITVDLSQEAATGNIRNVITEINSAAALAGSDLKARINDSGDGIILNDATGSGTIKTLEMDGGKTAKDLNILGETSGTSLDGTREFSITIGSSDTLEDISDAVNNLGIDVSASIINDGSAFNPYKLSILSKQSGMRGRLTIDNSFGMSFSTAAKAQDAILLYGGNTSGSEPAFIQNSTNTVKNIVGGLTLDLRSASSSQVTVTVNRDMDGIIAQVSRFVDQFNATVDDIENNTSYDPITNTAGILFGDSTIRSIDTQLYRLVTKSVTDIPNADINTFQEAGIRIEKNGRLTFDQSKFSEMAETKFDQLKTFFTKEKSLQLTTKLSDFRNGLGVDNSTGKDDFKITRRDAVAVNVNIDGAVTVADVLNAINFDSENTGSKLVASISSDGKSIVLTDSSTPTGSDPLSVTELNDSAASLQLGIKATLSLSENKLTGTEIDLKNDTGAASRIVDALTAITDSNDGLIDRKSDSLDDNIQGYNDKIDKLTERLLQKEERLIRQFAQLESFLAQSQGTMTRLESQLNNVVIGMRNSIGK